MAIYAGFSRYYDDIYADYDYEGECNYLQEMLDLFYPNQPSKILDIGCGTGRHAAILIRRGFDVTGIDKSAGQIERAERIKEDHGLDKPIFIQADMKDFSLEEKNFDVAISMLGSIGYAITDDEIVKTLGNINKHLLKEGLLIFEFWNIAGLKPEVNGKNGSKSWDKAEKSDYSVIRLNKSRYLPDKCCLEIDFSFIVYTEEQLIDTFEEQHLLRLYSPGEMKYYLERTGFEVVGFFDGCSSEQLKSNSFRIMAVAIKK